MILITASEGYLYHRGNVYADKVYIGKNDSVDNWEEVEITDAILLSHPGIYRKYSESAEYEDGTRLIDGVNVCVYEGGSLRVIYTITQEETEPEDATYEGEV